MGKVFVVVVNDCADYTVVGRLGIPLVTASLVQALKVARDVESLGYRFTRGGWVRICYLGLEKNYYAEEFGLGFDFPDSGVAKEFGAEFPAVIFSRTRADNCWYEQWDSGCDELRLLAGEVDCFQ